MDHIHEAIIENDRLPKGQRLSNVKLAARLGVSTRTLRRRRADLTKKDTNDAFFTEIPIGAISQRGKTVRLPDGSYEKITYKPGSIETGDVQRLAFEDLAPVFDKPLPPSAPPAAGTLVVAMADFQIGKTGSGGNTADTIERVERMIRQVEEDVRRRGGYGQIILADVGDSTEGFWNVASQAQTNDLSLTDQIRTVQRLYADALRSLAPLCDRLDYVAVPSNHCQVRTSVGNSNRANIPADDFGLMVSYNIEDVVTDRPGYQHVRFHRPAPHEEALTIQAADGTGVGFAHGHTAGSQAKVPTWFRDLAFGERSGLQDARILVHGHWHNFRVQLVGRDRWIISCPSADNGSDWWSNISGDATSPALLTFEVTQGRAQKWELYR